MSQGLIGTLRTSSDLSRYRCLGRMSEHISAAPPRPSLDVPRGPRRLNLSNLRICITSRPETDIKPILEPLTFRSISIHDEKGQIEDIENYIQSVVNTGAQSRRWKREDKQLVIDILTKHADGM